MTSSLKAKFLQHLVSKKRDGGFTLIELLVVIIIIGILAAIALPSFLNQANKAKESEAKTYVGSTVRAQQAYFLENNVFTNQFALVELGINTGTKNYNYTLAATDPKTKVAILASTTNPVTIRSFLGGVFVGTASSGEATTLGAVCRAIAPATLPTEALISSPTTANNNGCGAGFQTESK